MERQKEKMVLEISLLRRLGEKEEERWKVVRKESPVKEVPLLVCNRIDVKTSVDSGKEPVGRKVEQSPGGSRQRKLKQQQKEHGLL